VSAPARAYLVGPEDAGARLDVFLASRLELSRAQIRRLLARGAVRLDGRPVRERAKGERVTPGARVEVEAFSRPEQQQPIAEPDAALHVLARGPGWLAVDKPAGMPVHPLSEDETGTLLGAAVAREPQLLGVGEGGLRSGVVHRLDVDTSGALLLASRPEVWSRLRVAFREHRVDKRYRAVVLGRLRGEGEAEVELVMARHRPARVRVLAEGEHSRGARSCALRWRALEPLSGATLVEVVLVTGFLHQIRASFAHLGFPLAGDRLYGPPADSTGAPRQMLHAARVRFEEIGADSPDPADFAAVLAALRP
jgi:23S rRNA pseudouridine1911/1915/1917 synthase